MKARQWIRRLALPCAAVLLLAALLVLTDTGKDEHTREMNGIIFRVPEGYRLSYSDSRYAMWVWGGTDRGPGRLILDADIRDENARNFAAAEDVLDGLEWLEGRELYVNPNGVRMARGFTDYNGQPERRYYIESAGAVLLLCMNEDARYYDVTACEEAILRTADSARPNPAGR